MARCVFCHGGSGAGHTEACPMSIPVSWAEETTPHHDRDPGVDLGRSLITAWRLDTCVYDRGESADVERLEGLWDAMDTALAHGDVTMALGYLFEYYNPETSARTHGHGAHGVPSPSEGWQ